MALQVAPSDLLIEESFEESYIIQNWPFGCSDGLIYVRLTGDTLLISMHILADYLHTPGSRLQHLTVASLYRCMQNTDY